MINTKADERSSDMATMAIADEKALLTIGICTSQRFKASFNRFLSNLVASPTFCIACPTPILVHLGQDPCSLNSSLSLKDDQWMDRTSISTNTFHDCDPFCVPWLYLISLLFHRTTNDPCILSSYTDVEAFNQCHHCKGDEPISSIL